MNVLDLLSELRRMDIKIRAVEGKLRINAPKGALSSDLMQELESRKSEIIAILNESAPFHDEVEGTAIRPVSRERNLPLSWTQQRLWFLNQFEPDSPAYNIPSFVRLKGYLDPEALERCLKEVVRRHEVLRTTFTSIDGEPAQVISPRVDFSLSVINLEGLPEKEAEEKLRSTVAAESRHIFNLRKGPLLRATLLRAGETDHYLLFVVHHIAFDGWSAGVLVREMCALYSAFTEGRPSLLPELDIQYADFACRQRQRLSGETVERRLAYWKTKLSGRLPKLQLPIDFPHDESKKYRGAHISAGISPEAAERLKSICREENATLFMGLLAAFKILLHRYSGMEDIIVGCPIANRNRTEIEGLIGCFLNTLALRTDLSGNPGFRELLNRVRESSLGAFANQDLPFEKLLEEIRPEREINRTPIFQVMFVLQNAPMHPIDLPGLSIIPMEIDTGTAKFDLNLHAIETEEGILAVLQYNADLFDSASIKHLLGCYLTLIENIAANPDLKIADYHLLGEAEKKQLRSRRNLIRPDNPFTVFQKEETEQSIASRFEQIVRRFPSKTAVRTRNGELTYEGLSRRSNSVANTILKVCKHESETVALLFEHDLDMPVGVLGTLKAGKTYVPLDPSHPAERLAYLIGNSGASLLITNDLNIDLAEKLQTAGIRLINIDDPRLNFQTQSPDISVSPDAPAYIIYTSGSTGRPKGVVQTHRNVLHFTRVYTNSIHICPDDRLTLISSYCFDAAVMDIFGALLNGATLHPVDIRDEGIDGLSKLLIEHKISIYHSTPTVYRLFMEILPEDRQFNDVRLVVLGGEAVYNRDVDLYKKHFGSDCLFLNGLGPTESTVSLQYFANKETDLSRHRVPVGYPVQDTDILLINNSNGFDDIYGEIGIKSRYITPGYWNEEDMTKAAFLPGYNGDGERIYRTGDLARLRPDGSMEFLGRKDDQIKIRGYRIEVGEVEMALGEHPAVESSAVFAKTINGTKHLVGCVVTNNSHAPGSAEFRQFLQSRLPDYMVPSAFAAVDSLPLTSTGKIDRRSLPLLDLDFTGIGNDRRVDPRTPTERSMVEIWSRILGTSQIGVEDNFFELGGHSLLAVQMISRIRSALDVDLPLRSLFENPTIADIAAHIDRMSGKAAAARLPMIAPVSRDRPLPLSFSQERLWFLNQMEPENAAYHITGGVRLLGRLRVVILERVLLEIIRRHEVLRTTFSTVDGSPVQLVSPISPFELQKADLEAVPETERAKRVERIVNEETLRPFDLSGGPLLRTVLIRLGDTDHLLVLAMHHIVTDAWSLGLFAREFEKLYKAFSQDRPSPLPDLPFQYADFSHWQREWLQGEVLDTQLEYWKKQLGGEIPVLQLPTDRPRPAVQTYRGTSRYFALPMDLAEKLKALSQHQGATLFMTLMAAFMTLLFRHTGQTDFAVGSPIANRNRTEIEGLIGFFVNTLVLRADASGDPNFLEFLGKVRETALEAFTHQDIPFEKLVEELRPTRDMSHSPLFQVMFALQNAPVGAVELPGLTLAPVEVDRPAAQFDLTLFMWEEDKALSGRIEYNTDLFDAETVARLTGRLEVLLNAIVADPQCRLSELRLLPDEERRRLLVDWNATQKEYPGDKTLVRLFEEQVERSPDAVALVYEDVEMTYRELNSRSNRLAHYLMKAGVGPEIMVGLYMERSLEMVIAIYGVIKAGGAYVPLDPEYPPDRIAFMIEDTNVPVLLTQQHLVASLHEQRSKIISLDSEWDIIARESPENPRIEATPENMAYVIYTSGSTGKPKGVINEHRGIVNRLLWMQEEYSLTPADMVLQKTPFSFDVSVWEFFWPLQTGACLVVAAPGGHRDSAYLVKLIADRGITTLHFVPSMLGIFLQEEGVEQCRSIKRVICSGEALSIELQKRFFERLNTELHNLYGPTEAAVDVTYWPCRPDSDRNTVPIGYPVANTQMYVLDAGLNPVPQGCVGELHIGGIQVARGYLNRPELTAKRFICDPFATDPNARLYKTGDLARYLPDGSIEYLGRTDFQIKIRGLRVELGEIEARLEELDAIQKCVVVMREDRPGDQRLVAYYVIKPDRNVEVSDLRNSLRDCLPDYMIPSVFEPMDTLPLTSSGKVNRLALPRPSRSRAEIGAQELDQDLTETEKLLAEIWKEVLGIESLSVHDNFFELGGHSLLSIQVIAQIEKRTGVRINPREFIYQTLGQLAASLEQQAADLTRGRAQVKTSGFWERIARKLSLLRPRGRAREKRHGEYLIQTADNRG
jgi:amino acid adenylation domain-containing protein